MRISTSIITCGSSERETCLPRVLGVRARHVLIATALPRLLASETTSTPRGLPERGATMLISNRCPCW